MAERLPSGKVLDAHYCLECFDAKYVGSPRASDFPRPTFTLKNIMRLSVAWAIPNAIIAWVMRSGYMIGTPEQLDQWSLDAFVGINLVLTVAVLFHFVLHWLSKVMSFNRSGGLMPMPTPTLTLSRAQNIKLSLRMAAIFCWIVVAKFLEEWLTPKFWPRNAPDDHATMLANERSHIARRVTLFVRSKLVD